MSMEPTDNPAGNHALREKLDQVLSHHFERITGTRYGIHGLPLTLTTVACIVLLADREEEVDQEEDPGSRYDLAELEGELEEMALGQDDSLDELLVWLQGNGYIELDEEGRIFAGKPTISMAQLLEHAFPGMPGLNLVAYFIQTLDEIQSERKAAEGAFFQLDQILRRHSAGPFRKTPPTPSTDTTRPGSPPRVHSIPTKRPPSTGRPTFVSPIRFKSPASEKPPVPTAPTPAESAAPTVVVTGNEWYIPGQENPPTEEPGSMDSRGKMSPPPSDALPDGSADMSFEYRDKPSVPEDDPVTGGEVSSENSALGISPFEEAQDQKEVKGKEEYEEAGGYNAQKGEAPLAESHRAEPAIEEEAGASEGNGTASPDTPLHETPLSSSPSGGDAEIGAEDIVAERIAAFEEKLAMQCPVCRQAFVEEKTTVKGKTYYTCTDEHCVFISWGRPHHVECPRCSNPFLVESASSSGEIVLKCPRATCRHKQPLYPGTDDGILKHAQTGSGNEKPRKKRVVRRKRVRRKR